MLNGSEDATDFDEIWFGDAEWVSKVKVVNFQQPYVVDSCSVKDKKTATKFSEITK